MRKIKPWMRNKAPKISDTITQLEAIGVRKLPHVSDKLFLQELGCEGFDERKDVVSVLCTLGSQYIGGERVPILFQ